ncbi:MAG: phage tail protein [Oscillospiraceae bacterium]|nr:phage tail protein [Oscillospiraceae bacterium]
MYEIILKNGSESEKLHDMASGSARRVAACEFSDGVNSISSAQITVFPQNPAFDNIHEMTSTVEIVNTKTGNVEFEGRVLKTPSHGMDSSGVIAKKIVCEGFMGYLYDTVQRYQKLTHIAATTLLRTILAEHNAQVPEDKQIFFGACNISGFYDEIELDYEQTFKCIKRNLLDPFGGELWMRRNSQGQLLLDWLATPTTPVVSQTTIELAKNIVSLNVETDASHIITRLFPYGAKGEDTNARLTIEEAIVDGQEWGKTYIDDANAIAQFGVICGVMTYDDIDDPTALYTESLAYMQENNRIKRGFQAEVLDLSTIGIDSDALEVGKAYRFKNRLIGLDEDLRLVKKTVNIFKPYKPTVQIGDKAQKITSAASRAVEFIEYELPKTKTSIIDSARAQASALINNATKGYIYVDNDNGELLIMDAPEKENAQKVWRWNSGGFGYTPDYQNGQGTFTIAMTMDNTLVADFVMAASVIAQNLIITGGKIDIQTTAENYDYISLNFTNDSTSGWHSHMSPLEFDLRNAGISSEWKAQAGAMRYYKNGVECTIISPNGFRLNNQDTGNNIIQIYESNGSGIVRAWDNVSNKWISLNEAYDLGYAAYNNYAALEDRVSALEGN